MVYKEDLVPPFLLTTYLGILMTNQNTNAQDQFDDEDTDFLKEDQAMLVPRITMLKNKATRLGIKFSPNIGEDTLAAKIESHMLDSQGTDEEAEQGTLTSTDATPMSETERRILARQNANLLVRVNIHPNDPLRQQMRGEYVVTGNLDVGTIAKFVPFGTTNGYLVPKIIIDILKDRTFTFFQYRKDAYQNDIAYPIQRPAYNIQELAPLTDKELAVIRNRQLAQARADDEQDNLGQ